MELHRSPGLHDQFRPSDCQNLAAELFVECMKQGTGFGTDTDRKAGEGGVCLRIKVHLEQCLSRCWEYDGLLNDAAHRRISWSQYHNLSFVAGFARCDI